MACVFLECPLYFSRADIHGRKSNIIELGYWVNFLGLLLPDKPCSLAAYTVGSNLFTPEEIEDRQEQTSVLESVYEREDKTSVQD